MDPASLAVFVVVGLLLMSLCCCQCLSWSRPFLFYYLHVSTVAPFVRVGRRRSPRSSVAPQPPAPEVIVVFDPNDQVHLAFPVDRKSPPN